MLNRHQNLMIHLSLHISNTWWNDGTFIDYLARFQHVAALCLTALPGRIDSCLDMKYLSSIDKYGVVFFEQQEEEARCVHNNLGVLIEVDA
jgi:hypothetical protein